MTGAINITNITGVFQNISNGYSNLTTRVLNLFRGGTAAAEVWTPTGPSELDVLLTKSIWKALRIYQRNCSPALEGLRAMFPQTIILGEICVQCPKVTGFYFSEKDSTKRQSWFSRKQTFSIKSRGKHENITCLLSKPDTDFFFLT